MNLIRAFTEHPASVGESYGEHLFRATYFGTRMVLNRRVRVHQISDEKRLPL